MKKKSKTLKDELRELLNQEDRRKLILSALVDKAIGGDMKAFDTIRDILNEEAPGGEESKVLTVKLGEGVEELAR